MPNVTDRVSQRSRSASARLSGCRRPRKSAADCAESAANAPDSAHAGAPSGTGKVVGGQRPAQVGARLAAVAIGRAASTEARNARARLCAIVVRPAAATKARNARQRLWTVVVATAAQQGVWTDQRLQGQDRWRDIGRLVGRCETNQSDAQRSQRETLIRATCLMTILALPHGLSWIRRGLDG